MANSWLRLWHDMPNDPKWRTIARVSKQSIPAVLSVYVHLLVIASNATERGRTQNVCSEDLASALDLEHKQVDAILAAMQGRVLDGDMVSGWAKRQVEREDGSAERAKRWREAKKEAKQSQPNANERKQTPDTDTDTEKEIEKEQNKTPAPKPARFEPRDLPMPLGLKASKWDEWVLYRSKVGKKPKPETWEKQIEFLSGCIGKGINPADVIDESIRNGWQGLFEPKRQQAPPGKQANRDSYAAQAQAAQERLNGGQHEPTDERDITGQCARIA